MTPLLYALVGTLAAGAIGILIQTVRLISARADRDRLQLQAAALRDELARAQAATIAETGRLLAEETVHRSDVERLESVIAGLKVEATALVAEIKVLSPASETGKRLKALLGGTP